MSLPDALLHFVQCGYQTIVLYDESEKLETRRPRSWDGIFTFEGRVGCVSVELLRDEL